MSTGRALQCPNSQRGNLSENQRGRAEDDLSGILGPRRRTDQLHGQSNRRYGPGAGFGQGRSQPKIEQSRLENYSVGDRVRCVIKAVDKLSKGPWVVISRVAPELVMRLFEQEVPEIYDGTIVIKGCAREAGERTKIAVQSRDRYVNSVGACVGMQRAGACIPLPGNCATKKSTLFEYWDEPVVLATHALGPAKI